MKLIFQHNKTKQKIIENWNGIFEQRDYLIQKYNDRGFRYIKFIK